jgi:uncharacterized membrane protein
MIALLVGAWMLSRVMSMHAATAGEIWDHTVQRHGVAVVVVGLKVVLATGAEVSSGLVVQEATYLGLNLLYLEFPQMQLLKTNYYSCLYIGHGI